VEAFMKGDRLHHFMAFYDLVPGVPVEKRISPREYAGMSAEPIKCTLCSVCGGA
jgi:hypothetical protein